MIRQIGSGVAGLLTSIVAIMVFQSISHLLYPLPVDIDPYNPNALALYIDSMPFLAFALLWIGYVVASFLGGLIIGLISPRFKLPAIIVGVLLTLAGIMNFVMLPHPVLFVVICLLTYIPMTWVGFLLTSKGYRSKND